jgi:hypothetical protein
MLFMVLLHRGQGGNAHWHGTNSSDPSLSQVPSAPVLEVCLTHRVLSYVIELRSQVFQRDVYRYLLRSIVPADWVSIYYHHWQVSNAPMKDFLGLALHFERPVADQTVMSHLQHVIYKTRP